MKISFAKPQELTEGAVVLGVYEGRSLSALGVELDRKADGALSRAMAASRFEGKKDQSLMVLAPANLSVNRVLLLGVGQSDALDALAAQNFGGRAVQHLAHAGDQTVTLLVEGIAGKALSTAEFAANAAFGARLRAYRFDKYMTKEKKDDKPSVKKILIALEDQTEAKRVFTPLDKMGEAIDFTRDLVTEPANVINPETLAERAKSLEEFGVEVEILGEKQMRKLGMGALLGVGQGSARESQLVVMRWNGAADQNAQPLAFIGKGVTFDSGGISIKPSDGMEEMKWDMGGSATVIGLMRTLAARKARVNAVGVVGLVENMPSGEAQRPGDVVTAMSGETIEVINTDAEGRLVLADALWYTQDRFKPRFMIDLATLTGAIIISLGHEYAGLFSSDDDLAERLLAAGKATDEKLWRMPLGDAYDKQIKSDIADIKNTGGRAGGSITAAQFLKHFVNDVPWAHIDIAGMAWTKKDSAIMAKGASAFGVRLLNRLVAEYYEEK